MGTSEGQQNEHKEDRRHPLRRSRYGENKNHPEQCFNCPQVESVYSYVGGVKTDIVGVKQEFNSFKLQIVREMGATTLALQQVKSQSKSRSDIAKVWHDASDKEIVGLKDDIKGDRKAVIKWMVIGVTILSIVFSVCTMVLVWRGSKLDRRYEQILSMEDINGSTTKRISAEWDWYKEQMKTKQKNIMGPPNVPGIEGENG